jgi:hypothetical protein
MNTQQFLVDQIKYHETIKNAHQEHIIRLQAMLDVATLDATDATDVTEASMIDTLEGLDTFGNQMDQQDVIWERIHQARIKEDILEKCLTSRANNLADQGVPVFTETNLLAAAHEDIKPPKVYPKITKLSRYSRADRSALLFKMFTQATENIKRLAAIDKTMDNLDSLIKEEADRLLVEFIKV